MRLLIHLAALLPLVATAAPARAAVPAILAPSPIVSGVYNGAQVGFDARGNATAVFATVSTDGVGSYTGTKLWSATRSFGSLEFEAPRQIGANQVIAAPDDTSRPIVAVDAAGNATALWMLGHNSAVSRELWIADRPAGSSEFGPAVQVVGAPEYPTQFNLARGDDGTTTIAWLATAGYDVDQKEVNTVRARVRPAGSATFQPAVDVSPGSGMWSYAFSAAPDGGVAIAWTRVGDGLVSPAIAGASDVHVARKAAGAGVFRSAIVLSGPAERISSSEPLVAQAPGGATTVAWPTEGESVLAPGNGIRVNISRTVTPDGTLGPACPMMSSEDSNFYSPQVVAMASDSAGNITALWPLVDRLVSATQLEGQSCFERPAVEASGLTGLPTAELAADARGGLFLLSGRQVGYRPAIGANRGDSIPGFIGVSGFGPGGGAPSVAVDPFGNAQFTWSNRTRQVQWAIVDRAPPTMSAVTQAARAVAGTPTPLTVPVVDDYSSPVAVHWAFSDGTNLVGASVSPTFKIGLQPSAVVTATDASGNAVSQSVSIAQEARAPSGPKTAPPVVPKLTLSLSRTRFRAAAGARAAVDRNTAASGGTRLTVRAAQAGQVRFRLARSLAGHRAGKACRPGAPSKRHPKACSALSALKGTVRLKLSAGTNTLRLTGRWGARALRPGRYRLTATVGTGGSAHAVQVTFRIKR